MKRKEGREVSPAQPFPPQYYRDYLALTEILSAQRPVSARYGEPAHDEMLFIVTHQAYELWFKQILHETDSILRLLDRQAVREEDVATCVHRLGRVIEIEKLLIQQISILETMTPLDFLDFRDYLHPASGFQSLQFRLLEIRMGLLDRHRLNYDNQPFHSRMDAADLDVIRSEMEKPSLFQLVEKWLERTPFLTRGGYDFWEQYRRAVARMLEGEEAVIRGNSLLTPEELRRQLLEHGKTRDDFDALFDERKYAEQAAAGHRRLSFRAMQSALFISLYRDEAILHLPHLFLSSLVEMDEHLSAWRYRHALMVLRMIGTKIGTGGSSGHRYLAETSMKHKVFQDLAGMSTYLIPRKELPKLPPDLERTLGFNWQSSP